MAGIEAGTKLRDGKLIVFTHDRSPYLQLRHPKSGAIDDAGTVNVGKSSRCGLPRRGTGDRLLPTG
jgi:hypothetical protein